MPLVSGPMCAKEISVDARSRSVIWAEWHFHLRGGTEGGKEDGGRTPSLS